MLLTVKQVAELLQMRPSTLYAWAAQGKIPARKIYGVLRFQRHEINAWLDSFAKSQVKPAPLQLPRRQTQDIDQLIASAKRAVLYSARGNQTSSEPRGKEEANGAR